MDDLRKITHEGELHLGDFSIPCYILEDGIRVLSGRGMQESLRMVDKTDKQTAGNRLDRYLNQKSLETYLYKGKTADHYEPITCYKGNTKISGFEATVLVDICDAFLEARKNESHLSPRQSIIADQCEILVRSFAKVGIIALVDEATGYQYERERFELQKVLAAFVSEEVLKWQRTFDIEFYKEIFRLWGIDFTPQNIRKKPKFIGKLTTKYIYEQLPYGTEITAVLKEKSERREDGGYKYRFHQSLTPNVGREALKKQIHEVTVLMCVSDTKEQFQRLFSKRFSAYFQLDFFDDLESEQ